MGITNNIKALQFHRITDKFQFCGTWNTPGQFDRFLYFLQKQGINMTLPGYDRKGVVITFDDGEKNVYEHAFPILKKYNVRAVVFLITDFIGKMNIWDLAFGKKSNPNLSWDEIGEMSEWGILFGSHTMSHRNLTRLKREEIEWELRESKNIIAQHTGSCLFISYPFNRVNAEVVRIADQAGYQYGFGGDGSANLLVKKEAIYITDTVSTLQTKLYETPHSIYWYERVKQRVINYCTIATMLRMK